MALKTKPLRLSSAQKKVLDEMVSGKIIHAPYGAGAGMLRLKNRDVDPRSPGRKVPMVTVDFLCSHGLIDYSKSTRFFEPTPLGREVAAGLVIRIEISNSDPCEVKCGNCHLWAREQATVGGRVYANRLGSCLAEIPPMPACIDNWGHRTKNRMCRDDGRGCLCFVKWAPEKKP